MEERISVCIIRNAGWSASIVVKEFWVLCNNVYKRVIVTVTMVMPLL